jgi:hypothetical protein
MSEQPEKTVIKAHKEEFKRDYPHSKNRTAVDEYLDAKGKVVEVIDEFRNLEDTTANDTLEWAKAENNLLAEMLNRNEANL